MFPYTTEQVAMGSVGMTLRDYFAAAALSNLFREAPEQHNNAQIATRFYAIADAML